MMGGDRAYRYEWLEVSPYYLLYRRSIYRADMLIGFYTYLQETAVLVCSGNGQAIGGVTGIYLVDSILVTGKQMQELPGGGM
ncbi:hypothetical protein CK934_00505 [Chitinophaga sp. MD30]|nr:hypothetical protein CK934_00505 [Chitinophaga sp. MD30]